MDIRDNFTPNAENFFGRVGGPYLFQQWRDLLDLNEDHPTVTTFANLKKSEKADKMAALLRDGATRGADRADRGVGARRHVLDTLAGRVITLLYYPWGEDQLAPLTRGLFVLCKQSKS